MFGILLILIQIWIVLGVAKFVAKSLFGDVFERMLWFKKGKEAGKRETESK